MKRKSLEVFDIVVYFSVTVFTALTIYPFLNVISVSLSDYGSYLKNPMMIIPKNLNFETYKFVLSRPLILSSYRNTIIVTICGTAISMFLTITMAYPLANRNFKAKPFFTYMAVFTMLFNGGLVPNFYLVRSLGLLDTLWALILPGSLSIFNVILMSNFIKSIPDSLEEAARIDGASDIYIMVKVILPLCLPIIATLSLFYAVGRWNSYFNAIVYIRDRQKWTLQLMLREVVLSTNALLKEGMVDPSIQNIIPLQNVKYTTIVVAILPILFIYPFLQKYFIKGIMIGAIKG